MIRWIIGKWKARQARLEREAENVKRWNRLLGLDEDDWIGLSGDEGGKGHTSSRPEPYLLPEPRENRDSGHSGRVDNTPRLK
jgi:hypothetical protein